ncbi:MAG TPA: hypothetical protein VF339_02845 [Gammaproteobacteria bacterium]
MRQLFVNLALIGFLCRALVPVGFMPAPLADGGPIRICDGGIAGALLAALTEQRASAVQPAADTHADAHHSQHDDHQRGLDHEGWERCPIGTAFAFAVLAYDLALPLPSLEHVLAEGERDVAIPRALPSHYHARAPPLV